MVLRAGLRVALDIDLAGISVFRKRPVIAVWTGRGYVG